MGSNITVCKPYGQMLTLWVGWAGGGTVLVRAAGANACGDATTPLCPSSVASA